MCRINGLTDDIEAPTIAGMSIETFCPDNDEILDVVMGRYRESATERRASEATTSVLLIADMSGATHQRARLEALCQYASRATSAIVDWSTYAGRYHIACEPEAEDRVRAFFAAILPALADALPPSSPSWYRARLTACWLSADGELGDSITLPAGDAA